MRNALFIAFFIALTAIPSSAGPIDDVKATVNGIANKMPALMSRTEATVIRLRRMEPKLNEFVEKVQPAVVQGLELIDEIRFEELLDVTREELASLFQRELEERAAFLNGDAEAFRLRLIRFVEGLEGLLGETAAQAPVEGLQVTLSPLLNAIRSVPAQGLYVLYRMLGLAGSILQKGTELFEQARMHLQTLKPLRDIELGDSGSGPAGGGLISDPDCEAVIENLHQRRRAARILRYGASAIKSIGRICIARGTSSLELKGGVHGYVGLHTKDTKGIKVGNVLLAVAQVLETQALAMTALLSHCTVLHNQQVLLDAIRSQGCGGGGGGGNGGGGNGTGSGAGGGGRESFPRLRGHSGKSRKSGKSGRSEKSRKRGRRR